MECPSCRHVCREEAAKFCSQCGKPLPRAVPAPESENNPTLTSVPEGELECGQELKEEGGPMVTSVPEGEMERGQELKEEGGPMVTSVPEGELERGQELKEEGGPFPSLGSSDRQESLDEPGSWTTHKGPGCEVCVDTAACSAGELEAANCPPSKRRKEDSTPLEVAADGLSADLEQSKSKSRRERRKRQSQGASAAAGPASSSLPPSTPCSLHSPANPTFQGSALPPRPAQQGGRRGSLPGQAAGGAEAAPGGESPGSLAPQGPAGGGALPQGKGQEGAGPTPTPTPKAGEGGPGKEVAAQEVPPLESDGAHSEPRREPRASAPASAAAEATAKTGDPGKGAEEKVQNETQKSKQPPASVPASREHRQETEAKDKTAVSGEKAKPQAPKKATGAPGQDVAATSKEKAQKGQKADARGAPESPLSPGEGVPVFFHAIISKDFGLEPQRHRVFVRGGAELGEHRWRHNVCEMYCIRHVDPHGYLVEGSTVLARQHLDKPIPYKYVVARGEDPVEYEFIYEKQKKESAHVDRCLRVKSALLGAGGWHQYDDIACKKPPETAVQKLKDLFTDQRKNVVKGKKIAATVMLDSLFGVLRPWSATNLSTFFSQFRQLYSVVSRPMIHEAGERPWSSLQYEEKQVKEDLWEHLRSRAAPFLCGGGEPLPADFPVRSRLRMGLIVLLLVREFKLPAIPHDLPLLCGLLCCDACPPEDFHADLSPISETPQRWREALTDLCDKSRDHGVDLWVGILPVLHFCTERPARGGDPGVQREDTWAALEGVPFKEFRETKADGKTLLQLMGEKKHLLDLDAHLFRSWFSLLPLTYLVPYLQEFTDHLSRFPAHVLDCLLGTFHRLQGLRDISNRSVEDVEKTLKMLLHLLDMFQDNILEKASTQSYLTVCLKLHETVCKLTKEHVFYELPALSAEIVRAVVTLKPLVDSAAGQGSKTGTGPVRSAVQTALNTTKSWLQGTFNKSMFQSSRVSAFTEVTFTYKQEVQVWRRLVEINFPAQLGWRESLLRDMEGRLKQESPRAQISAFCSTDWKGAGAEDSVAKCFENCVIEAVSSACQSQTSVLEGLSYSNLHQFGTLVSTVITKSWPRNRWGPVDDPPEVLKYLLTGPDIKHLFRLYGTDEKLLRHFTEEGRNLMATADSITTKVACDLLSGTVLVGQLELIWNHRVQFLDIWELKRKSLSPSERKQGMKQVLRGRWEELTFLQRERSRVGSLLRLCEAVEHLVKVDLGEIAHRHLEDLSSKRLNDAVTARPSPTSSDLQWATHYCLSPSVQEMARRVHSLKDSHIFRTFWEQAAEALRLSRGEERPLVDLEDAYEELYRPCLDRFGLLYEDLKSGQLTLAEVDTIFKVFVNQYGGLTADLNVMCALDPRDPKDWVPERVGQIREYHHLQRAADVAKVIREVKEALGLTGDFDVLHVLLRLTDHVGNLGHGTLGQIDEAVVSANRLLQDVDEARCQALQELATRRGFITWVRGALGGIHELKVFVDLASISAGENDIDVDRVACFHDAVQGYACLLYKLDASAGFREFMELLKELWKALENDRHLPRKLRDSARNLEWLKTVKDSHGSVELSSLSLATAINSRGVYVVQAPADGEPISPDTVLRLRLPETHGAVREEREYSLEELKELLNKLMLMSGRKDQNSAEVEVFSEVFSNMERLVHSFISLYSAGNLLFRDWQAKVCCSPSGDASMQVDFGPGPLPTLEGQGPPALLLEAICRQMEHFLGQWEAFVAQKRAEHFYLNFYTAEQLVYLSTQLLGHPPEDAALTMLSFLKPDCCAQDVREACQGPGGAAARWRQPQTQTDELLPKLRGASGLADKLRVIMEQSLTGMCDFLPHCLDLEGLGRCLAQLARKGRPPVARELPKGLRAGRPNLIVCGPSEVLLAALAVYMHSPRQPLPTYDEVLLCTPDTTFEEVALLLRRCLSAGSRGRGVYSLLHVDQLSYEAACRAEALFRSLSAQPHREHYQLVLVCDAEREHCHLPSAFSQHKVPVTPQVPLADVQAYLAHHYQVPERTPSAAAVFRDQMCVGIVASERAGVGKSLYVKRLHETLQMKLSRKNVPLKIIRLIDPQVDEHQVLGSLLPFLSAQYQTRPMIFHFDVTPSVQTGMQAFLFKLLILQYLMDVNGKMWLRNPRHLYVVEILEGHSASSQRPSKRRTRAPQFGFLDIFPKVTCRPPKEVIDMELHPQWTCGEPGMDPEEFCSETFQRPFQYLKRFHQKQDLDAFQYQRGRVEGTPEECIQHLLIYCGVVNPSWSELWNFARFLNYQLKDCEASLFCNPRIVGDTLRGFKNFVVTFMILMARDFATPTLHTSDQSPGRHAVPLDGVREEDIAPFSLRRRWESEPHPYVFFNDDHTSMTFIGFHLQPNPEGTVDAVDPVSKKVIKKGVMTMDLYQGLLLQRVPFNVDFDQLPRHEKLERLCMALGVQWPVDPDDTYELTTDNMLKILAIEMRFRCRIPVIVMGETGCGKTRLIKFLSDLRRGGAPADTLKLVKVHGGTTADMIYARVQEAESLALVNKKEHQLDTVLFFDEANTTEAVSCIKEVLCDRTVGGRRLAEGSGLHVIAACNPYRKHSPEMISRLEAAGLGYRVRAEETADRLGSTPLRQLVYRVHALPPSLTPLVWDFGQLNDATERLYIQQIVQRLVDAAVVGEDEMRVIADVLAASQRFMRKRGDECGFASLRDVERCVRVFQWFHEHSGMLLAQRGARGDLEEDPVLWALVLALGVCYHASLEKQESYRDAVCRFLPQPYGDGKAMLDTITRAQDLFLEGVPLRKTVARNSALKENVFMMVVCIELRIPLFLVGKPGSSKSLAKTIVADAMQGQAAHADLFRALKQVHLVSFQCSPHSTPQGIIGTFRQCARFQQDKDLRRYVSVVVLDEVGLAEDSPQMPLKALHPLLEDGCVDDDDPAPHKKVGFIGISNWALDPAKMNRGVFVSRGSPDRKELVESAKGICSSDALVQERVKGYFAPFAKAYETVCERQDKEFFGLRDYYSLIKMVFASAKASDRPPSPQDIARAVLRNFSGRDGVRALDIFAGSLPEARLREEVSTMQLIEQNIYGDAAQARGRDPAEDPEDSESRYLLLLTRNYVALQILQQTLFRQGQQPEIIFGSSFPRDQEYTQVCRNINRVKVCMETGRTAVLLNLQSLYESLYDALNQYYVHLGGQKYVDLGLGTHRVKCRVHPGFRLIVIEEKDVVYDHFPIPLINRLEKHYLDIHTVLEAWQKGIVEELKAWVGSFVSVPATSVGATHKYSPEDVFIGYHSDTCASVVLQVIERLGHRAVTPEHYRKVLEDAKSVLLDCATPDAVVRLSTTSLGLFVAESLSREYYDQQQHDSFADFLRAHLRAPGTERRAVFTEITTFSRLLTGHDCEVLASEVTGGDLRPTVLSLQQFDTEHSFLREIRKCVTQAAPRKILIIQTDFEDGVRSAQLIASAKYSAINEINKHQGREHCVFVYFITKLSRMESGRPYVGSHGGLWRSVHIDDLRRSTVMVSDVTKLQDVTISQLFEPDGESEPEVGHGAGDGRGEPMEVETPEPGSPAPVDMETDMEMDCSGPRTSHTPALDTSHLLRSCVQSAVGLLQDPRERSQRNVRRVEVLLSLLGEDDPHKAAFSREAKRRLHHLLRRQESFVFTREQWVQEEASNPDALQEAGTFRHSLWKRVQGAVTPLLASMISVIDRDGNLELLAAPEVPAWTRDLWMFIFSDLKLLNVPLVANATRFRSEMSHIPVLSHMELSGDNCNSVPFSWRIKDYVDELGVQAQYISDPAGASKKLLEIFQQTPLGRFLAQLPGDARWQLFHCYLQDFLLLTMKVSNVEELTLLQMALRSCVQQLSEGSPQEELSLPWVHLAYQHFRIRLQNFSRILTIHPPILPSLTKAARSRDWAVHELTLDVSAALACAELLLRDLLKPDPQVWLRTVKKLSMPLELLCSDGYLQGPGRAAGDLVREVRTHWNRIFSVALFVEHVLLGTRSHLPELSELVTESAHILDKRLQGNSDIKTLRPFSAVMKTLCECKNQAGRTLLRFGVQACPVCLGDARDPIHLPCDHVFCLDCVRSCLTLGQMSCPLCLTELPEDFSPQVSQEARAAIEKHARFRHMCTSFFVDLVSTVCFKDNCPPDKDVVDMLLSLLFVEKDLLRGAPQRRREHTKSLSPFDDVVDKTPVIRSVVLKLLLKYSFQDVKGYIQDYLTQLEKKAFMAEDKTELYLLFSSCLEDSMREKSSALSGSDDPRCLREDAQFLQVLLRGPRGPAPTASVEGLQEVARVRLCLDRAADILAELRRGSAMAKERKEYLGQVERFCAQARNDWHRVYLVRKLTSLLGMESVQRLARPGHPAQWVFPQEVIAQQRDHPGRMDHFLVHGQEYKAVRDAVGKAVLECKLPALETALQACRCSETHRAAYLLLALFREVASLYGSRNASLHPTPEQREALRKFTEQSQSLSPDMRHFATSLVTNGLPLLRARSRGGDLEGAVTEMAVHAAVILLCGQHRVLGPLRKLAFCPAAMARAFLPTMPEDLQAQARRWKGLEGVHWYTCPNGHHCAVGECGLPMEQSVCVDCGAPVGGTNHVPQAGFTAARNIEDRTQTGHVLGSPPPTDKAVVSDRELAPVVFLLARLLTHLALLLGATHHQEAVSDIIRPRVKDPREFLEQHIHRDVAQLTKTLGRSADDTVGVVHLVLRSLLSGQRPPPGQGSCPFDDVLSTKEQRNSWEKCVETLIVPELEHLDQALLAVNAVLRGDERISSNPVAKLVFGDPASFLPGLPGNSMVHNSRMWSCRTRVTVEYLQNLVEQKNGKETVPVLWKFLQKEGELRLVRFLPEILALQRDLVKWFQNASEAQYPSIRDFIESHSSDGLRRLLRSRFELFLSVWNRLRRSLETHGEIKLPKDYCSADLGLDARLEVVLPRRQGLGLCSTALVSYLIGLHNEMVYAVAAFSEEEINYSVDASEVTDLHVISYEVERDLTPLILSNCQYQVEQGGESLQGFDLGKIQRQLAGRFLQGRPRLTLRGLPTLLCRRDWNYERLFSSIRNTVPQVPLPSAALSTISGQLQSHSDACEALSVIEVTLGFLSTAGEDPNMDLIVYIQDKLRISDQTEQVLKALHRCQLRHVIALWQLLSAHKSEQQLRLRKEPFGEISADYRVELSPEAAKLLFAFLNQGGLDTFLLELHELMVLKLKNPQTKQDFKPSWSLRDTLVSYMETKDGDIPPEMEALFPEEILLSNCVSVWRTAVELKRGRQTR